MLPIFIVTLQHFVTSSRIMGIKPIQSFLSCPTVHYLTSMAPQKRMDQSVLPPCICLLAHLCGQSSINELLAVRRPTVYGTFTVERGGYGQTERLILDNQQLQCSRNYSWYWSSLREHYGRAEHGSQFLYPGYRLCKWVIPVWRFVVALLVCVYRQMW